MTSRATRRARSRHSRITSLASCDADRRCQRKQFQLVFGRGFGNQPIASLIGTWRTGGLDGVPRRLGLHALARFYWEQRRRALRPNFQMGDWIYGDHEPQPPSAGQITWMQTMIDEAGDMSVGVVQPGTWLQAHPTQAEVLVKWQSAQEHLDAAIKAASCELFPIKLRDHDLG